MFILTKIKSDQTKIYNGLTKIGVQAFHYKALPLKRVIEGMLVQFYRRKNQWLFRRLGPEVMIDLRLDSL